MPQEILFPQIKCRYLKLLDEFKNRSFTFEEALNLLQREFEDDENQTKVILSELNKAGYLEVSRKPQDRREKIYKLKPLVERKMNHIYTKDDLINLLKQAADLIRTRVDYTFILLLLFYKAYSDKWEREFEEEKRN